MPRVLGTSCLTAAVFGMLTPATATAAQGATRAQWGHVARCESGGNWHLNTGNGYYGGLQMSARTWASFGGHHYARRADLAGRLEQIDVANRIYAADGWRPWRACAPHAKARRR
ncbi:MAG TPA: transglycosylase family protein [Mycobacteriales bacterium]|nr:transglycosylase family protein [Mycobacteriales bacterium]